MAFDWNRLKTEHPFSKPPILAKRIPSRPDANVGLPAELLLFHRPRHVQLLDC